MPVDKIREMVEDIVSKTESKIRHDYKSMDKEKDEYLSKVSGEALGQLMLNKAVFENVLTCLKTDNDNYNCFIPLEAILGLYVPNKKDWEPVLSFLLAKARRSENDYNILETFIERYNNKELPVLAGDIMGVLNRIMGNKETELLKTSIFLSSIVSNDGNLLPHEITNYDRLMFMAMGMSSEQIQVIYKKCRSLAKKNAKPVKEKEIKGTRVVNIEAVHVEIKEQRVKLHYLKRFISMEDYEIITTNPITEEEAANIITFLEDLDFKKDKIELVKTRIVKFNEKVQNNVILAQVEALKKELFTNEMFGLYDDAKSTVTDENVVFRQVKEQIAKQLDDIDKLILDCLNGVETKDNTCEYLVMAFEDLRNSLELCGLRLTRD